MPPWRSRSNSRESLSTARSDSPFKQNIPAASALLDRLSDPGKTTFALLPLHDQILHPDSWPLKRGRSPTLEDRQISKGKGRAWSPPRPPLPHALAQQLSSNANIQLERVYSGQPSFHSTSTPLCHKTRFQRSLPSKFCPSGSHAEHFCAHPRAESPSRSDI